MVHWTNFYDKGFKTKLNDEIEETKRFSDTLDSKTIIEEEEREWIEAAKEYHGDLKKNQRILETTISKLKENFTKSFTKFEANWSNWNVYNIVQWMKCLDDHKYEFEIKSEF